LIRGKSRREPAESTAKTSQRPKLSLKARALAYLSRREYSCAELARKLTPLLEEGESLEPVLDALQKDGWLSDSRFAESLVHRRASRFGATRIIGELKRHAVGDELIEQVATELRGSECDRAKAVWQKKYGRLADNPVERAKQARFLAARGFSHATIIKLLRGVDEDFPEV
jgi:regulatory protein